MINHNLIHKLRTHRLFLPFYVPALILAFCNGMLIPILPLYAKEFSGGYMAVGIIGAAQSLGMLISDVPCGLLLRRIGQRNAMLLGLGAMMLATMALFWARSVPEAVVYRLISGFGRAMYGIARHAYIADAVAMRRRGKAISMLGGMFRVGFFLGPMLGGVVAAAYGLRMPFLAFGSACGVSLVIIAVFVPAGCSTPTPPHAHGHGPFLLRALKSRYRHLLPAGAGQIFAQMIRAGRTIIIPLYAADGIGLDVEAIGLLTTLASGIELTQFWTAGWLMDNWGRKWAVVPSFAIQSVAMACVPLAHSFGGLLLCTSIIGLGNGLSAGAMMTLGADLSPADMRGEFLGVWRLIGDTGGMGGAAIVGAVADALALSASAWAMSGAGLLAALIFGSLLPETLGKET